GDEVPEGVDHPGEPYRQLSFTRFFANLDGHSLPRLDPGVANVLLLVPGKPHLFVDSLRGKLVRRKQTGNVLAMQRIPCPLLALVSLLGMAGSAVGAYDFVQIDVPGGRTSWAHGINDVGQIVGGYWDGSRIYGFVQESDGTFTSLDAPGSTD